jgi:hypothetical protein
MAWQQQAYTSAASASGNISNCQHTAQSLKCPLLGHAVASGKGSFFYAGCHSNEATLIFLMFRHDLAAKLRGIPLRFAATNKRMQSD